MLSATVIDNINEYFSKQVEFQVEQLIPSLWTKICETIASLIDCVPSTSYQSSFIRDLIYLVFDLSVLEESQLVNSTEVPVTEVVILSETRQYTVDYITGSGRDDDIERNKNIPEYYLKISDKLHL